MFGHPWAAGRGSSGRSEVGSGAGSPHDEAERKRRAEQKFNEWVRWKDRFDKGLELFAKLDSSRAESEATWKEAAIALAAVDRSLGIDVATAMGKKPGPAGSTGGGGGSPRSGAGAVNSPKGKAGAQSMYDVYKKWTMDSYSFSSVELTPAEAATFTSGFQENFEKDEVGKPRDPPVMPSIKYMYPPPPPRKGLKTRPMTNDQKASNAIFMRRLKHTWIEAHKELRERLATLIEEYEVSHRTKREGGAKAGAEAKAGEGKDGEESDRKRTSAGGGAERDPGFLKRKERFTDQALTALGIRKLVGWIEEDEDAVAEKQKERKAEKEDDARRAHEGWSKNKDTKRVRMPPEDVPPPGGIWKAPRFDFGGGKGLVRPNKQSIATTTFETMRGQGMKYVHAMKDLDKTQWQVQQYKREVLVERRQRAEVRDEERKKAFDDWAQHKGQVDAAVACLKDIDPPGENPKCEAHWKEVGAALKSVDSRLMKDWLDWSRGSGFSAAHCQALWDAFSPVACDVHSSGYSAVRNTLLKLLRPGVDYRAAFTSVIRRRRKAEGGPPLGPDKPIKEAEMELSKRELRTLLVRELGIVMGEEDMRRLVDAFDMNQDQKISWMEFEEFTGGTRENVRGDAMKRLSQRCVWETVCHLTGMPNAYAVTAVRRGGGSRQGSAEGSRQSLEWGGTAEVLTLANGEQRRRTEMPDRKRRIQVLQKYGMWDRGKGGDAGGYDEDDYESDHSGYDNDGFESDPAGSPKKAKKHKGGKGALDKVEGPPESCEACRWSSDKRAEGLRTLRRLSQPNREANGLSAILEKGKPPEVPRFWAAPPDHPDVGPDPEVLCYSALLCWRHPPGTLAAFFSLEMSVPSDNAGRGSSRQANFVEICRDPPDADGDPEYQFWVRDLRPNTSYDFRVRAFNGFGPGPYAHKCCTTRPARPQQPVAVWLSPTEVTLRWKFADRYVQRLQELKAIFQQIDVDGNGEVNREELLAALEAGPQGGLTGFLRGTAMSGDRDPSAPSLFDAIEANDDENITWQEFLRYFQDRGTLDAKTRASGTMTRSRDGPLSATAQDRGSSAASGGKYVVEQCEREDEGAWREVWKGTAGEATLKMLEPGGGYRFRVRALSCEGMPGACSESLVVNTLLETPAAPRVATGKGGGLGDTWVTMRWDPANQLQKAGARTKASVDKLLTRWTKTHLQDEGVSLAVVFARYDRDGSGAIDAMELANVLEDLGVPPTEERLREAFHEFDTDQDGVISLEEFEAWFRGEEVTYCLKRDEGVSAWDLEAAGGKVQALPAPTLNIVSYRGPDSLVGLAGLAPNTLYRFRLRHSTAKTQSALSGPLELMTAPRTPEAPVTVRTEPKAALLKWYPGPGGACKYTLQSRYIESLDMAPDRGGGTTVRRAAEEGWKTVYEGVDNTVKVTGLALNTVYRFRVAAVNLMGGASDWSDAAQVSTCPKEDAPSYRPSNAAEMFQVDANGDVVVGDVIIFTERLYMDASGELVPGLGGAAVTFAKSQRDGQVTPRLNMSVMSVGSAGGSIAGGGGEFVGERTVAAHVLKDSYLSMRKKAAGPRLAYNKASARRRALRLEVIWSTVSRREAERFTLPRGHIIERQETKMFQFETFRALWEEDTRRKTVAEEWNLLSGT